MSVQSLFQGLILRKLWLESTKTAYCKEDFFFPVLEKRGTASPGKPWIETFELSECALHSPWNQARTIGFLPALPQKAVQAGQWTQTLLIFLCCWTSILMYLQIYAYGSERKGCVFRVFLKRKKAKLYFLDVPSKERGRLEDCCKTASWKGCSNKPQTDPFFCILKDNKRKLYQTLH